MLALVVTAAAVVAAVALFGGYLPDPRAAGVRVPAGGPLPLAVEPDPDEPPEMDLNAPPVALAPPGRSRRSTSKARAASASRSVT
ncbi:MAG: hypothetical protein AUH85_08020 [Chloroflexi bacterium 13_1_40CM_4_68_4]|nr:MAG: hypothetical protein AUH85_08020 [Chloroflexi bacterium 13_1_40CM_4_68_4]